MVFNQYSIRFKQTMVIMKYYERLHVILFILFILQEVHVLGLRVGIQIDRVGGEFRLYIIQSGERSKCE